MAEVFVVLKGLKVGIGVSAMHCSGKNGIMQLLVASYLDCQFLGRFQSTLFGGTACVYDLWSTLFRTLVNFLCTCRFAFL